MAIFIDLKVAKNGKRTYLSYESTAMALVWIVTLVANQCILVLATNCIKQPAWEIAGPDNIHSDYARWVTKTRECD